MELTSKMTSCCTFLSSLVSFVLICASLVSGDFFVEKDGEIETSNYNQSISGPKYSYVQADFGPDLLQGDYKLKTIVRGAFPREGCSEIAPPPAGPLPEDIYWSVAIERSNKNSQHSCDFVTKVLNAQNAGYAAAIVYEYDPSAEDFIPMQANNETMASRISIPSVFVLNDAGVYLWDRSYPDKSSFMTEVIFTPLQHSPLDPYKILIPMAFTFVGILLITCIVMIVRWCQTVRRKRRSRISKSQLKKIPIQRFKKGDQYECCAICLDDYNEGEKLRVLPCAHTYHQKCIDPWLLKKKKTCPVCKRRVVPRTPRRDSDSTDSDSDGEDGHVNNENTPLLPPPTGNISDEERGAAGGRRQFYGSGLPTSMRDQIQYVSSSDEEGEWDLRQTQQHYSQVYSSTDSEDEDPRGLLIQVSMTPPAGRNQAHSLTAFTNPIPVDDAELIPAVLDDQSLDSVQISHHHTHDEITETPAENDSDSTDRSVIV